MLLDFKRSIPVGNTNIVNITNIIFPCFNSVTVCKAQHTMSTNAITPICDSFGSISIRRKRDLFPLSLLPVIIKCHPSAMKFIVGHSCSIIFDNDFLVFFIRNGNTDVMRARIPRISNELRKRDIIVRSDGSVVSKYVVFLKIDRTFIHSDSPI